MIAWIHNTISIPFVEDKYDLYILKDFHVHFSMNGNNIEIHSQKIILNEYDMNTLFDEFFLGMKIEYGFIGGSGCDFSINILPNI